MGPSDITPPMSVGRNRLKLSRRRPVGLDRNGDLMVPDTSGKAPGKGSFFQAYSPHGNARMDDQTPCPSLPHSNALLALDGVHANVDDRDSNKNVTATWLVERDYGWREYASDVSKSLENAFQQSQARVSLRINAQMYHVVFNYHIDGGFHVQINTKTRTKRHVRRHKSTHVAAENSQLMHGTTAAISAQVIEIEDDSDEELMKTPLRLQSKPRSSSAAGRSISKRRKTSSVAPTTQHGSILAAFSRQSALMPPLDLRVSSVDGSTFVHSSDATPEDNRIASPTSTGRQDTPDLCTTPSSAATDDSADLPPVHPFSSPCVNHSNGQGRYKRLSLKITRSSTDKHSKEIPTEPATASATVLPNSPLRTSTSTGAAVPTSTPSHSGAKVPCPLCSELIWPAHAYFHIETSCSVGLTQRRQQRKEHSRTLGGEGARGAPTEVAETLHPRPHVDWLGAVARPDLSAMEDPLLLPAMGCSADETSRPSPPPPPCLPRPLYSAPPDAPYYLRNFITVANAVMGASTHSVALLGAEEATTLRRLLHHTQRATEDSGTHSAPEGDTHPPEIPPGASPRAQMLAVRLLLRRHQWIRLKRVSYAEICSDDDMAGVVHELVRVGLATSDTSITDPAAYLDLLDVGELRQLWQTLRLPSPRGSVRRADMIQQLIRHGNAQSVLFPGAAEAPSSSTLAPTRTGSGRGADTGSRAHQLQPLVAAAKRIIANDTAKAPTTASTLTTSATGTAPSTAALPKPSNARKRGDTTGEDPVTSDAAREDVPPCAAVLLAPALVRAFKRLEMLFFMNRTYDEQTLGTLTLMDMSKATYPQYTIHTSSAPLAAAWPCRCAFWSYERALEVEFAMETATEKNAFDTVLQLYATGCTTKHAGMPGGSMPGSTPTLQTSCVEADSAVSATVNVSNPEDAEPSTTWVGPGSKTSEEGFPTTTTPVVRTAHVVKARVEGGGAGACHSPLCGDVDVCGHCDMAIGILRADAVHGHTGATQQHVHLRQFTAQWVWTRIDFLAVVAYERKKDWHAAVGLLRRLLEQEAHSGRRGRWYDHLALHMHVHFSDPTAALEVCIQGINDAHVRTGHKLSLINRAERICRSAKNSVGLDQLERVPEAALHSHPVYVIRGYALPDRGVGYAVTYKDGDVLCGVEELVMRHEQRTGGWKSMHCEGSLFGTLYGLLYWDVIFMDGVSDVFVSPQQTAPLDFFSSAFFHRRCIAIKRYAW